MSDEEQKNYKILEIRVGSHLFGTTTPDSDIDLAGIFMPGRANLFGFQRCENIKDDVVAKDAGGRNTAEAVDRTLYEYRKYIQLAMQNNPNILNMLFVDKKNILFKDHTDLAQNLLNKAYLFPHKGAFNRFVSYARSQRKKMMIKPENYRALQDGLALLGVEDDNKVMAEFRNVLPFTYAGIGKHVQCGDLSFEAGVYVKKARKQIRARLAKASTRTQYYTKYGVDVKFASNLIRLLKQGIDLMRDGKLVFPLPYAQEILDVKQGKYNVAEIMEWSEDLEAEARTARDKSSLPGKPWTKEIEEFTIKEMEWYVDRVLS